MEKISSNLLKSIFKRRGENGEYTMPLDEFNLSVKNGILSEADLKSTEQPVIAGIKTGEYWFLITDERLIVFEKQEIKSLKHTDIKDVSSDVGLNVQLGARQKNEFSQLSIITFSREKLLLKTEPGPPFIGIWNVLKTIAARNG